MANDLPANSLTESDKDLIQIYVEQYTHQGLSPDECALAVSFLKSLLAHRRTSFERKGQRQRSLLNSRNNLGLIRDGAKANHAGFLAALNSIEKSIDSEIEGYNNGDISR